MTNIIAGKGVNAELGRISNGRAVALQGKIDKYPNHENNTCFDRFFGIC